MPGTPGGSHLTKITETKQDLSPGFFFPMPAIFLPQLSAKARMLMVGMKSGTWLYQKHENMHSKLMGFPRKLL
jgi:hypothetical protein